MVVVFIYFETFNNVVSTTNTSNEVRFQKLKNQKEILVSYTFASFLEVTFDIESSDQLYYTILYGGDKNSTP